MNTSKPFKPKPWKHLQLTAGQKWGHLTLIGPAGTNGKKTLWRFLCACGQETIKQAADVRRGKVKHCSAVCPVLQEHQSQMNRTHGAAGKSASGTVQQRLFRVWSSMKQRCSDPNSQRWHRYGGRGIRVSPEWLNFETFRQDMAPSYQPGLQLDRINNDLGYSKQNCRWVTPQENVRNSSRNLLPPWVLDAADKNGIKRTTLHYRIRAGVPWLQACTEPPSLSRKFTTSSTAARITGS